jgi:hypothetical protein
MPVSSKEMFIWDNLTEKAIALEDFRHKAPGASHYPAQVVDFPEGGGGYS